VVLQAKNGFWGRSPSIKSQAVAGLWGRISHAVVPVPSWQPGQRVAPEAYVQLLLCTSELVTENTEAGSGLITIKLKRQLKL